MQGHRKIERHRSRSRNHRSCLPDLGSRELKERGLRGGHGSQAGGPSWSRSFFLVEEVLRIRVSRLSLCECDQYGEGGGMAHRFVIFSIAENLVRNGCKKKWSQESREKLDDGGTVRTVMR